VIVAVVRRDGDGHDAENRHAAAGLQPGVAAIRTAEDAAIVAGGEDRAVGCKLGRNGHAPGEGAGETVAERRPGCSGVAAAEEAVAERCGKDGVIVGECRGNSKGPYVGVVHAAVADGPGCAPIAALENAATLGRGKDDAVVGDVGRGDDGARDAALRPARCPDAVTGAGLRHGQRQHGNHAHRNGQPPLRSCFQRFARLLDQQGTSPSGKGRGCGTVGAPPGAIL
jgi:hypothetical protein